MGAPTWGRPLPDIFLSYNREDQTVARRFAEAFEREGFSVWWDTTLRAGEAYDAVTEKALREARAVVVLWSKRSVESRWVRAEATLADRNGTLIPCMIEPCERPIMFELTQTAELAHWQGATDDRAWQGYVDDVRRSVTRERAAVVAVETLADIVQAPTPPRETLLAVLPFDNLSSDAEMAFFSDGVSEDILGRIMRGSKLKVIGRTSSFQFRGADKPRAAAALNATHVLDGSIRRAGDKVRIAAHLTEADGQTTLWTDRYDRGLEDIFAVQDEISEAIAAALDTAFFPLAAKPIDPAIYDLYLKAREPVMGMEARRGTRALLQAVTAAAPEFADGWATLAMLNRLDEYDLPLREREPIAAAAKVAAARCLALDPENVDAVIALADFAPFGDFLPYDATVADIARLGAASSRAQVMRSLRLQCLGRGRESLEVARLARTIDPLDVVPFSNFGMATWQSGAFAEGRALLETAIERQPDNHYAAAALILAWAHQQDWDAVDRLTAPARLAQYPLRELSGAALITAGLRDLASGVGAAMFDVVRASAERIGRVEPSVMIYFAEMGLVGDCYDLLDACRFGPTGDKRDVLGLFAYRTHLLFPAAYTALRADPRFVRLCARLGLVEYWLQTGNWPDCAQTVPYDFRAECEANRHIPIERFGA